jgi:DNA-binding NarL/FixJ family response regulator
MDLRILLASAHEMIRAGLVSILEAENGLKVVGEVEDGRSAVQASDTLKPHVVIIDAGIPSLNGIEATRQIVGLSKDIAVIVLSTSCDLAVATEALRSGALGYLLESSAGLELILAVRAVVRGDTYLSPKVTEAMVSAYVRDPQLSSPSDSEHLTAKQREILQLLVEGKSNKEVAASLSVSKKIVETHRAQISKKLQIKSLAGLTKFAIREGITTLDA